MQYKDYYDVIGVKRDATEAEIKRAYRKLARKYHPDVSTLDDAEARFKEVGEAYEVLKDPEKRAAYDQLGENFRAGQDFHAPPGWDAGFEFRGAGAEGVHGDFSDFFESLFGRGFERRAETARDAYRYRGEDHHAKVMIDLSDAVKGATRDVTLRMPSIDADGHLSYQEHTLRVRIPAGVREGQRIRLAGQGARGGGGGAAGDLFLEVGIKPHPLYRVDGGDLYFELPITPWEAALGASISTPTPNGDVQLKIPPGTQSGKKLRLKGRGLPGKPSGDLYVIIHIALPPATTDDAKAVYRHMKDELDFDPRVTVRSLGRM